MRRSDSGRSSQVRRRRQLPQPSEAQSRSRERRLVPVPPSPTLAPIPGICVTASVGDTAGPVLRRPPARRQRGSHQRDRPAGPGVSVRRAGPGHPADRRTCRQHGTGPVRLLLRRPAVPRRHGGRSRLPRPRRADGRHGNRRARTLGGGCRLGPVVAGSAAALRARHVASVQRAGRRDRPAEASGMHRMCCLNPITLENWGLSCCSRPRQKITTTAGR